MNPAAFGLLRPGWFASLSPDELQRILDTVTVVELDQGAWLFREGDVADAVYVILSGAVQVVGTTDTGTEIVLNRLESGDPLGERSLVDGTGRRSASIRAAEPTKLVRLGRAEFEAVLAHAMHLRTALEDKGATERENDLAHRSGLVAALRQEAAVDAREVVFPDEHTIFREGDAPDAVYAILTGRVGIYADRDGFPTRIGAIGPGGCVGELGAMRGAARMATAVTSSRVRALRVPVDAFRRLAGSSERVQAQLATLERVYALPNRGFVTHHAGFVDGRECVTRIYSLAGGRRCTISQEVGRTGLWVEDPGVTPVRALTLASGATVHLDASGRIGRIDAADPEISPALIALVLDGQSLSERDERALAAGQGLVMEEANLCGCLKASRASIRAAIQNGAQTLEALQVQVGCGTVCGGCVPSLQEMLGQSAFTPMKIAEVVDVAKDMRAFRLASPSASATATLGSSWPGQHVVLRATIGGRSVERPYTLSSPPGAPLEVTIKREPHGVFSPWLFEHGRPGLTIGVSAPRGDWLWDGGPAPVVCFVAGIGATPAICFARTLHARHWPHELVIDWSARTEADFACLSEIEAIAVSRPNVHLVKRVTSRDGRLGPKDVTRWADRFPTAEFFVCGPDAWLDAIGEALATAHVPPERIHVERFTAIGAPVTSVPVARGGSRSVALDAGQARGGLFGPIADLLSALARSFG